MPDNYYRPDILRQSSKELEIVSFFFPFLLSFILYIGDNVDFKYGGGESHLHEHNVLNFEIYNLHI